MTQCEAMGPLPMLMDDWHEATFWSSFECRTDGVDRGEATESSSNVEGSDAADVNTETSKLVKPEERTDINTSDSANKAKDPYADVKLWDDEYIQRDRDSSVHFQKSRPKNVDAGKKKEKAAAESSVMRTSSKRKSCKHKDANAPKKKKKRALSFDEDGVLYEDGHCGI